MLKYLLDPEFTQFLPSKMSDKKEVFTIIYHNATFFHFCLNLT